MVVGLVFLVLVFVVLVGVVVKDVGLDFFLKDLSCLVWCGLGLVICFVYGGLVEWYCGVDDVIFFVELV